MSDFCIMFELKNNYLKYVVISFNCTTKWIEDIRCMMQYLLVSLFIKYLDIPLGASSKRALTWKPVIERIEKKLSLWKGTIAF